MKRAFSFIAIWLTCQAAAQTHYWQQQVDMRIDVTLNDVKHTLDGFETMTYHNNAPDTLHFIWIHLWPNAFKNDKTAFSEQMVEHLDDSRFYFSKPEERGYINKLEFKVDGLIGQLEDHPQYIDVAKLILPKPLLPGQQVTITTPFHVQIPYNFSRGGHVGQSYQITQWYPKPAVYDKDGWHPMPYLDQGEFYNDLGNYEVSITLPKNYVVGATGQLQEETEKAFLLSRTKPVTIPVAKPEKKDIFKKVKQSIDDFPPSDKAMKTIHYKADQVTDFAWFADKRFVVKHEVVSLPTNAHVDAYAFVLPSRLEKWKDATTYISRSLKFYSAKLGDYPYGTVSVVCAPMGTAGGGMEYPNITLINNSGVDAKDLDRVISHEVGHNWLQGMIATNERDHAWMDEGMNSYYEQLYLDQYWGKATLKAYKGQMIRADALDLLLASQIALQQDQPMETTSEEFTEVNYQAVAYAKGALWMKRLESMVGTEKMQAIMRAYFSKWKMRHPGPKDFKQVADSISGQDLSPLFDQLHQKGDLNAAPTQKPVKLTGPLPIFDNKNNYVTISPAIGYNAYDRLMVGALVHNFNMPGTRFKFAAAPLYATGSRQLNMAATAQYDLYPKSSWIDHITPSLSFTQFNIDDGTGLQYENLYRGFSKWSPAVRIEWKRSTPTSNKEKWIEWRSFFISEGSFDYKQRRLPQDTFQYYAQKGATTSRAVHQLRFGIANNRHLYPYRMEAQVQKAGDLYRLTLTGNYFFNYSATQGINIRFFGGKILYTSATTDKMRYDNSRYHLTMYGANGDDDYTYSNAFIQRNQSTTFPGRQIMIRDGGFKYRSDYSSDKPGRTDDWLAALNFTFDVPKQIDPLSILPFDLPLKVFADVGTYAEAWKDNNPDPKFLYSMGLQLSVMRYVNLYWAIIQSKQFKAPNELNGTKWWQQHVTFSIDIQNISTKMNGLRWW